MGRYYNDFLEHKDSNDKWDWPNGNNSKEYNHNYYETHKAKWDTEKSVDQNIADNLLNYGAQAIGPDQPGLSDDFQRNLAKRRIKQLEDDTKTRVDIAKEELAAHVHSSPDLLVDAQKRKDSFDTNSLIRAVADVPLAAVATLIQAGKSIIDKLSK